MVGKIIRQERINQKIKSKDLAEAVGIDTGHLSHIEKGARNPSKSILLKICNELNLSYQFMLNVAQNTLEESSEMYDATTLVPFNKVLYAEEIKLINCPKEIKNVSLVTKMQDSSMEPNIPIGTKLFIQYTSQLLENDVCIVVYNENTFVRKFSVKEQQIILTPFNSNYETISVAENDPKLSIIGKIVSY